MHYYPPMSSLGRLTIPFLFLAAAFSSACGFTTVYVRHSQPPFIEAAQEMKIALVLVDVPEQVREITPQGFHEIRGVLLRALQAAFAGTRFTVVDRPASAVEARFEELPFAPRESPGACDPFAAAYKAELRSVGAPVAEPLLLAVKVIDWAMRVKGRESSAGEQSINVAGHASIGDPFGAALSLIGTKQRVAASVDLVYTLWTRSGQHVETRRVHLAPEPRYHLGLVTRVSPERRCVNGWDDALDPRLKARAPQDMGALFEAAVNTNALAFAWLYGPREVNGRHQWDESEKRAAAEIERIRTGKVDEALRGWERILAREPGAAPALFNSANVLGMKGQHREALRRFERALKLDSSKRLYRYAVDKQRQRVELQRTLTGDGDREAASAEEGASDAAPAAPEENPERGAADGAH